MAANLFENPVSHRPTGDGGKPPTQHRIFKAGSYLLWEVPPSRVPPLDPLSRVPVLDPPLLLPELRLPPEFDLDLSPTEPELRSVLPLSREVPDFGSTVRLGSLVSLDFLAGALGFTPLEDPDRFPTSDAPERLLPGRTCRVRSLRSLGCPVLPEFQTRVPFFLGSTGLMVR